MISLLVVTLLHLFYFAVSRAVFRNVSPLSFLVQYQVTAQYLVVQLDVGPFSMRVYNALLLGLFVLSATPLIQQRINAVRGMRAHMLISALFIAWLMFSSVFNGNLSDPKLYGTELLSKYIIPILSFLGALALVRNKDDLNSYVVWIFIVAVANAVFALIQSRGVGLAWDVQRSLYPYAFEQLMDREASEGVTVVASYPPGLSQYSIGTGYVITCLGMLGAGYALAFWNRTRYFAALFIVGLLAVCLMSSIVILSRSSLYIGLLLFFLLAFAPYPSGSPNSALRVGILAAVAGSVFVLFASKGLEVTVSDYRTLSINRVFDLSFEQRFNAIREAMDYTGDNLMFGGKNEAMETSAIRVNPHNFIFNALLYSGVMGGLLAVAMHANLVWAMFTQRVAAFNTMNQDVKFMRYAAGFALMAYVLKGLVHNDSFVIGGGTGWMLLGVYVICVNLESRTA